MSGRTFDLSSELNKNNSAKNGNNNKSNFRNVLLCSITSFSYSISSSASSSCSEDMLGGCACGEASDGEDASS